jgi:acetyltransferase-like isoleucine patch superfamily enzyme
MKKSLLRRISNRLLGSLARVLPGATTLRPALHRLRGVKIVGRVFIGDDVYLENEYPENVEIQDGAQICLRSLLLAHTRGVGKIVIGRNAFIGANTVITTAPGRTVTIGEGAVIATSTVVSSDVPSYTLFGIAKGQPLASVTVPLTMETSFDEFVSGLKPLGPLSPKPR